MRRVALAIGNGNYIGSPLRNPVRDATSVGAMTERLGFETTVYADLSRSSLDAAITRFAASSRGSEMAVCFYAGHAFQISGSVYLVPVDWVEGFEKLIPIGRLLGAMGGAKTRVALIDACRNNPFRDQGTLGRATSPTGSRGCAVLYATQAGAKADDGDDEHSPFTTSLLRHMETPGIELVDLYRQIANDNTSQAPELWLSHANPIYFRDQ